MIRKLDCFDQEHHAGQTLSPQQFSTLTRFPNFLLLQGIEKSDFFWTPVWGPKTLAKTGPATEGLPSSRTCVATNVRRAWRTSACGAAKPWKSSGMENFCRVRAETIEPLAIFRPVTLKFCRQNGPRFGVQKRIPKWRPLIQS